MESERMSNQLMKIPAITQHIRRLACLDLSLNEADRLVANRRWIHEAT